MSDRYVYRPMFGIWRCTEEGQPVVLVNPLTELNSLWRLVEDTASLVRATERAKVHHALLLQDIRPADIKEVPEPPPFGPRSLAEDILYPTVINVKVDQWNRIVRALKAIAETVLLS